jgi:hypothetical protein
MSESRISRRLDEKRLEKQGGHRPLVLGARKDADDSAMPRCGTCRFAFGRMPDPSDLRREVTECKEGSAQITFIPMGGGIAKLTGWPIPNVDHWCHRHEPIPDETPPITAP